MLDVVIEKLERLSGDAVKLALWIAEVGGSIEAQLDGSVLVSVIATAEWVGACSKKISLPAAVVRKCLAELVNHGVLGRAGRARFVSNCDPMSYRGRRVARSSEAGAVGEADDPGEDEVETPPWEASGAAGRKDPRSGAKAPQATLAVEGRTRRDPKCGGLSVRRTVEPSTTPRVPATSKPSEVCVACGEPQAPSPGGDVCPNGHGGAATVSAHKFVVDAVVRMYADCYSAKLTVDGKAGAIVSRLLKLHSAAEIVRRARIMFYEPRRWPSPPYHFGSLSSHFDSFVTMKKPTGGMADRDRTKTGANYYGEVDDV